MQRRNPLREALPVPGFLPEPIDGWSNITALYVARYGVPREGQAVFIRTRQHIDGWTDNPILTRAVVRPANGTFKTRSSVAAEVTRL